MLRRLRNWCLSWFAPKENGFSERERLIFRYFDGQHIVGADPLKIHAGLLAIPDLIHDSQLAMLESDSPVFQKQSSEASSRLAGQLAKVFHVQPFTEVDGKCTGLTDAEIIGLLVHFDSFLQPLKKKPVISPTSAPTTAVASSPDATSPTPSGADSPGIATDNSTVAA